ncbi:MAG TPA: N-acetylmuramoyl-L-alanine amidase [Longimicrobiaceae bacterium]|nr:N-acetylmuramoyl-L-alanine amidase [Longimicrobiaceae bacterium]
MNPDRLLRAAAALAVLGMAACNPRPATAPEPARGLGVPPVPRVEGPLAIRVVHPTAADPLPRVDSTFVFGSVGSGGATLTINGTPVQVAPNGAFLAFVAVPPNGAFDLVAQRGSETARVMASFKPAPPAPSAPAVPAPADTGAAEPSQPAAAVTPRPAVPPRPMFPQPLAATISGRFVSDTLATGSDVAPAFPAATTDLDRKWLLPRGTRAVAVSRLGHMVELRLDAATSAWVSDTLVTLGDPAPAQPMTAGAVSIRPSSRWVDVRVPVSGAPFLVSTDGATASVTLYGVAGGGTPNVSGDAMLRGASWGTDAQGDTRLDVQLAQPVWGYKVFYEADGTLVLRLRRPPRIDANQPLRGIRLVLDPGHPPGGAIGPTALTEAEANLALALRLADKLRARGAEVIMTRTTGQTLVSSTNSTAELGARVTLAVRNDADILLSVHNNAFAEGTNPFTNHGTSTLYFHPQSLDLARALDREIVGVTRIPDLGAKFQNIALGRPTWMPAVLTESLFMMFPDQENALRDPEFLDRLADAHVRGLESFLRDRATSTQQ